MAWDIIWAIDLSPLAEMVPTCAISDESLIFFERAAMSLTAASTALSTPRFRSIGFMPAATALAPSRTIAWASTVAVVVPSPARSEVLLATSRTIWAPMFSNLSSSSISFATVTPSLVMRGAPYDLSRITLRPFGPSVTLTALLRISTPRSIRSRASEEKRTSLADMMFNPWFEMREQAASGRLFLRGGCALDHTHDVGLLHDQKVLAVDLDLGAGPFAEQHPVARFEVKRNELAAFVPSARSHGDDLALLRLLLDGVGNDDAAFRLVLTLDTADDDTVMQWTEFHEFLSRSTGDAGQANCPGLRLGSWADR